MTGKLLIFSAPSGSGKSTIVKHLMQQDLDLAFSISATSRNPRQGERDGHEYYFLSVDEFRKRIEEDAFIEWEEVYEGQYYGTLRSELDRIWQLGQHAVFDIDVQGGINLKKAFGQNACSVFIEPPSLEELEKRLRARGSDNEASLARRLNKARHEMSYATHFDHILLNDSLDKALREAEQLVRKFIQT